MDFTVDLFEQLSMLPKFKIGYAFEYKFLFYIPVFMDISFQNFSDMINIHFSNFFQEQKINSLLYRYDQQGRRFYV